MEIGDLPDPSLRNLKSPRSRKRRRSADLPATQDRMQPAQVETIDDVLDLSQATAPSQITAKDEDEYEGILKKNTQNDEK